MKLQLSFDIGHSSIGWAVLAANTEPEILGCGTVTFQADDCLASKRRVYRRQRRHIRSTRQRIARMKTLFQQIGVLTKSQLDKPGSMTPWKLAADALAESKRLSWPELWDVLRWYAHNRGYDGNRRWSSSEPDADQEDDTKKVENARTLMQQMGKQTVAETVSAYVAQYEAQMVRFKAGELPSKPMRFKGMNSAFPREIVEGEVRRILLAQSVSPDAIAALMDDWTAIPSDAIKLPNRYQGGLLFGQLVPRFDNRIIAECPVSQGKVPSRECAEFYRYRWAMQLANVLVLSPADTALRPLHAKERQQLTEQMQIEGGMTAKDFEQAIVATTACTRSNLKQLLLHPDAKDALILDPVAKLTHTKPIAIVWPVLTDQMRKRIAGKWRNGKSPTLGEIIADNAPATTALRLWHDGQNTKRSKKDKTQPWDALLKEKTGYPLLPRRAPYARTVMQEVFEFVLATNRHPAAKAEGDFPAGPLYFSDKRRRELAERAIDDQTNNHLIRHRLRILQRLHKDLRATYPGDISRVTVEVNRDLREMSGMTAKEKAQDLGKRTAGHHDVAAKLEKAFAGKGIPITAGLIRKARIAEDLAWTCPYTGLPYDPYTLLNRGVDKDHIIPRKLRPTDSLEALAITFPEVNAMKRDRTAMRFLIEDGGKKVEGTNLTLFTLNQFKAHVEALETYKGHDDDKRRKKRRKENLLLEEYTEKTFTPGDLTQTSQLTRLGMAVIEASYPDEGARPVFVSMPGSVTGAVRKSWHLLGCMGAANPNIFDEDGSTKTKTDIREITHLHHALDACVLALASFYFPRDGGMWELMVKRSLNTAEQFQLSKLTKGRFNINKDGRFDLKELDNSLKENLRARLAERRVVQHLPTRLTGLRVEENTWRVVNVIDGVATLRQSIRQPDGTRTHKEAKENASKLLGLLLPGDSKLADLKGALVIPNNFGVVLDPEPTILPWHKVWPRLMALRAKNGGKMPRVLRNGQLISVPKGNFSGIWRVFSIKNNATGIALDIGRPDVVKLRNKTIGHKINVRLSSLLKDGMLVLKCPLTGVAAPAGEDATL